MVVWARGTWSLRPASGGQILALLLDVGGEEMVVERRYPKRWPLARIAALEFHAGVTSDPLTTSSFLLQTALGHCSFVALSSDSSDNCGREETIDHYGVLAEGESQWANVTDLPSGSGCVKLRDLDRAALAYCPVSF